VNDLYDARLAEDARALRYGLDVIQLMTSLVAYHDARWRDDDLDAAAAWKTAEHAARSLDSYYVPIDYEWPGPGLVCKDGLTRSQLRELMNRCRRAVISATCLDAAAADVV
jgi:hypothetical protein